MSLNDQLKAAKRIQPREQGSSIYAGRLNSDDPARYYKLNLKRSSNINLSLTGLTNNADLTLLNRKGKQLSRSKQAGNADESITRTVPKGTYYVRVANKNGNTRYRLSLSLGNSGMSLIAPKAAQPANLKSLVQQIVALTNVQRQQHGLRPVKLNSVLSGTAQAHTEDMAFNDFFAHTGSNGSSASQRLIRAGYHYAFAAENIAGGYSTPAATVQAWMNSPGHRANILNPNMREVGVGFYFLQNDTGSNNYRYYWTQDFGTAVR